MKNRIHPTTDIQTEDIGANTNVWQFCVVLKGARIGENCNICSHCLIENDVIVGNNVTVKSGVQLWDGVTIEDNVFIGPNVTFTNDLVPRSKSEDWKLTRTIVKKGATIGANATVIAGIEIGEYSFIGAGSLVSKSIPSFTIWYGNPAVHKGYITDKGVILGLDLVDKKSGAQYKLEKFKLTKK